MNKVIIIGSPGAGKSVFARKLAQTLSVDLFHMDNLYWRSDKTHISREELIEKLRIIFRLEKWIIDGNYLHTMDMRIKEADTIFFLDYPVADCLQGITERTGIKRDDIPWFEENLDQELIEIVKQFPIQSLPLIKELLIKYSEKTIYCFKNRSEANLFLINLTVETD